MKTVWRFAGAVVLVAVPFLCRAEPVSEPQLLLYYHASFDGKPKSTVPVFGARLDRVPTDSASRLEFGELIRRPGFAEVRFNDRGLKSFTLAGVHYDSSPVVARADEEEGAAGEGEPETEAASQEAPEQQGQAGDAQAEAGGEKTLDDYIKDIPVGYFIGVGIGIVILAGVGG